MLIRFQVQRDTLSHLLMPRKKNFFREKVFCFDQLADFERFLNPNYLFYPENCRKHFYKISLLKIDLPFEKRLAKYYHFSLREHKTVANK